MTKKIRTISELKETGKRYSVKVTISDCSKVVDKYRRQEGTISDESGQISFVVWSDSGLPYLEKGREYVMRDVLLYDYKGSLQVQFDRYSKIESKTMEKLKNGFQKLYQEEEEIEHKMKELYFKEKDIQISEKKILKDEQRTLESIRFMENKRQQVKKDKIFAKLRYLGFIILIAVGGIYIYEFTMQKININNDDVIEISFKNIRVPYKVVTSDDRSITLQSMDSYKERLEFKNPMNLSVPGKDTTKSLENLKKSDKSKVYTYNADVNKGPIADPNGRKKPKKAENTEVIAGTMPVAVKLEDTIELKTIILEPSETAETAMPAIIYVNTERDDNVLSKLPGIGSRRIQMLKDARPYYDVRDVMEAKIGIGNYWAIKWKEGVKKGRIVFD
ncbi:hypothetical protein ACFLUV_04895 [Elusimicrobiota bacterium]